MLLPPYDMPESDVQHLRVLIANEKRERHTPLLPRTLNRRPSRNPPVYP